MFLKTGELKKIMKSSLKRNGLIVGNINNHYMVCSDNWGVYVDHPYATNKFKAAVIELTGDLPEPGECYRYEIVPEQGIVQNPNINYNINPFEMWKQAKNFAVIAPICFFDWPHEYIVLQEKQDLQFIVVDRALTINAISRSELDDESEHMPGRPSFNRGVLYFKNESMIYWVNAESPQDKISEVLFKNMESIDFFEDDWIRKIAPDESNPPVSNENDQNEADENQLPF